jgi:ABC-type cobalamin/Fe3+-siderophores transport system ATPase subunit
MAALEFRVVTTLDRKVTPAAGVVVLVGPLRGWNDYGYRCSFRVYVPRDDRLRLVGTWKILDTKMSGPRTTALPARWSALPAQFVALGQDRDSYEALGKLPHAVALGILHGLRDVVYRPRANLDQIDGFQQAMARFADARAMLDAGRQLLEAAALIDPTPEERDAQPLRVQIRALLDGFPAPHELALTFSTAKHELGLRRVAVVVGPNGVGKTQLLAAIARALSGLDVSAAEIEPKQPFSHVIAVSYSAFDRFKRPQRDGAIGYVYCGLRTGDPDRMVLDLDAAMSQAIVDMQTMVECEVWVRALTEVQLDGLVAALADGAKATRHHVERLSAGQQLVALTITNLAAQLQPGSVVLYDEPEVHLHPRLLAGLLRAIHQLLDHFDSYAIVATHSLIPPQETPSSNIVILDRPEPSGPVRAHAPVAQCFAATLDEISRVVFGIAAVEQSATELLIALRERMSVAQIRELLGGELSLGTRLVLASLEPSRKP